VLVNRQEVIEYAGESAGRPNTNMSLQEIKRLIDDCNDAQCQDLLQYVRQRVDIHPLERQLNCKAEIILESIARAADITVRGIRGIITEVAFKKEVLSHLTTWKDEEAVGELPYDFLLTNGERQVTIQVKMQRSEKGSPIVKNGQWFVETQRTRNGTDKDAKATRPYRFGQFDILAVSLQPTHKSWDKFMYTLDRWLLPRKDDASLLKVMQPVSTVRDEYWTDNLEECIDWFFNQTGKKTIPDVVRPSKAQQPRKQSPKKK
jgi:hypothetical protein